MVKKLIIITFMLFAGATVYAQSENTLDEYLKNIQQFQQNLQNQTADPSSSGIPNIDPSLLQGLVPSIVPQFASLSATPASPSPGQIFTVAASLPQSDVNSASFSWSINGRARTDLSGQGRHTIELTAGDLGTAVRIDARIAPAQGDVQNASLTVFVSELSLIWRANTYAPKWYKGKALASPGSEVIITALPRISTGGTFMRPENLIYRWDLENNKQLSGTGKNIFRFKATDFAGGANWMRVTVEDTQKRVHKEADLFIKILEPKVAIYNSSPLGGIEPRRVANIIKIAKNSLADLVAEPFFFAGAGRKSFSYEWRIGGTTIQGSPDNPNILTIDAKGVPQGETQISVSVNGNSGSLFLAPVEKYSTLQIQ